MRKLLVNILFGFLAFQATAQEIIQGRVIDSLTQKPIEGAAVFFDQTSFWTITDANGHFEMQIKMKITAPLFVSYLGYERIVVENPFDEHNKTLLMQRSKNELTAVTITGYRKTNSRNRQTVLDNPRNKKHNDLFQALFIGKGKASKKTKIINLEVLRFSYDSVQKVVSVFSKVPLVVENNYLKYRITYNLDTASIAYSFNKEYNMLIPKTFVVAGKLFFQDLLNTDKDNTRFYKRRDEAYFGSVLHFMRTLKRNEFKEEGFSVFRYDSIQNSETSHKQIGKKKISAHFEIIPRDGFTEIIPPPKFSVIYKDQRSSVTAKQNFGIDELGNYFPWNAVQFVGFMGRTGISTAVPLNYAPKTAAD